MNDDDNSGFSIDDLGFTDDNKNNSNANDNLNNKIPGINGGFTSNDLYNNENTNNLSYDFNNMSNSNNSTFLNNGLESNSNISTGSGANNLINVISDDSNNSSNSNSIFNRPKEEDVFNVPPDLEGGFNSPPPEDEGDFIVPPNFSSSNIAPPVDNNVVNVQNNQQSQNSNINLIDTYREEEKEEGGFKSLFSKKNSNQNNNTPGFSVKNKILREKSIFTDFEVFKSFSKIVVDVIVFVVVAILLYKLYVKENTNVIKKLPRGSEHYKKVCTVEKPFNDTVIMSGAFGLYEYDGKLYLDEVVMWTARTGKIKIPDGQTESEVVDNFVGLSGNSIGIEKGNVIAVNNYYKKPGMVFTSQTTAYENGQYTIDVLVKKYLEYGANCV